MKRTIAALAAGIALGVAGTTAVVASQDGMTQDDFPCHEDEVLGYSPEFGRDHVGCIHREDLEG